MKFKKLFLALTILVPSALAADTVEYLPIVNDRQPLAVDQSGPMLRFSGEWERISCFSANDIDGIMEYVYVNPETASRFAGNSIKSLSLCAVFADDTRKGYIFIAEDDVNNVVCSTECNFKADIDGTRMQSIDFDNPYTIKDGIGFYYGFYFDKPRYYDNGATDYYVALDERNRNSLGGYLRLFYPGSQPMEYIFESNIVLWATTVGPVKSVGNLYEIIGHSHNIESNYNSGTSVSGLSGIRTTQQQLSSAIEVQNFGDPITSAELMVAYNDGEPSRPISEPVYIRSYDVGYLTVNHEDLIPTNDLDRVKVHVYVNSINGVELSSWVTVFDIINVDGPGFDRKVVAEQGTATWCGYCPHGIVAMQNVAELYPERFIGIAVHGSDELSSSSYNPILGYFSGYPAAIVNRDKLSNINPAPYQLLNLVQNWADRKTFATIDLQVEYADDGSLLAISNSTFAIDDPKADYAVAYALTEDKVTGVQTNYYAGNSYKQPNEWWAAQGRYVQFEYSNIARDIFDARGIVGSIPATVAKATPYTHRQTITLDNVDKLENTAVTALLLDRNTGVILNAARVYAANYQQSGVETVEASEPEIVDREYYDLQGRPVILPSAPGIYLRRDILSDGSASTTKVIR